MAHDPMSPRGRAYARSPLDVGSVPPSQSSSFNDSMTSQQSVCPLSSTSNPHLRLGVHTPATSLSNNSSQEHAMTDDYTSGMSIGDEARIAQAPSSASTSRTIYPTSRHTSSTENYTSAPKRLANGEFKSPKGSLPTSPTESSIFAHSRHSSTTSRSSQIGELSAQLRTRLSYAMIKVQHGWQDHTISELEKMTSQQGSPVSATSDRRGDDIRFAHSPVPSTPKPNFHPLHTTGEHSASTASSQASTYEAFWREHSSNTTSRLPLAHANPTSGPTLAPPVDILPRNRHPETVNRQPTRLHTKNLPQATPNTPSTPQTRPAAGVRTPSQQAAVEKVAVESLLFMSSPGNSGYYPRNPLVAPSSRTTALPESGTPTGNRARYNPRIDTNVTDSTISPSSINPLSERDIDRLLDEMPDDSSDDEDDFLEHRNLGQVR
ncbi:MAG: hypothetical protein Q9217_004954, partial [Psora testacea]